MSTVTVLDKKITGKAVAWKWPGAIFACKPTGADTFIEWDDSGPVPVKTAQQIADAQDEYAAYLAGAECKADKAASIIADPALQAIFEALWELHQGTQPNETKAQYAARLKTILAGKL